MQSPLPTKIGMLSLLLAAYNNVNRPSMHKRTPENRQSTMRTYSFNSIRFQQPSTNLSLSGTVVLSNPYEAGSPPRQECLHRRILPGKAARDIMTTKSSQRDLLQPMGKLRKAGSLFFLLKKTSLSRLGRVRVLFDNGAIIWNACRAFTLGQEYLAARL